MPICARGVVGLVVIVLSLAGWVSAQRLELSGDGLVVVLDGDARQLTGTIHRGADTWPFTATLGADQTFTGTFTAGGQSFPLTLVLDRAAGQARLETGGKMYQLKVAPPGAAPDHLPVTAPGNTIVLEKRTITDATTQLPAANLLVPRGWRLDEKVIWRMHHAQFVTHASRVSSPQGDAVLEWIPLDTFVVSPMAAQAGGPPAVANHQEPLMRRIDVQEYLLHFALPRYRNLHQPRVTGYQELPDISRAIQEQLLPLTTAMDPNEFQVQVQAGKLRVEYTESGKAWEEDAYCAVMYMGSPKLDAMMREAGMNQPPQVWITPERCYSFRAPKGQLDAKTPILQTILASAHATPKWHAFIQQLNNIRFREQAKGAMDRARIRHAAQQEINQMQMDSWRKQQAAQDRIHEKFVDTIRGVERYHEPSDPGAQVILPGGYEQAWSDGSGTYIISNDPNYDPNGKINGTWQEMPRKK